MTKTIVVLAMCACTLALTRPASRPAAPKFAKAYALKPAEGVFAYSRISPDGHYLAYASEIRSVRGLTQTVTVVDLPKQKVIYSEAGIDAYFSTDGTRMIYSSFSRGGVSMFYPATGAVKRNVAPPNLGDYYSWARRDGKDLILTITSNYYFLQDDQAVMPNGHVKSCPNIPIGDRPLISRDGMRITTFMHGTVVVRDLMDCDYSFDTGIRGAKSDFSWDGRYIAMHAPKDDPSQGYDLFVVDLQDHTVRNITSSLKGSSYYPSWTTDGRLSFRYDGDDYHGFMFASDVLSAPAKPLPTTSQQLPAHREWSDMFPESQAPPHSYNIVLVYGTWSAHSPIALAEMEKTRDWLEANNVDVGVTTATAPGSVEADVQKLLTSHDVHLPRIPLDPSRAPLTEVTNQSPSTLLFRDGVLIDRRLGAQSFDELRQWVSTATATTGVK